MHVLSSQQGSYAPPQASQVSEGYPVWQAKPVVQVSFAQQGWFAPPQAWHVPVVPPPLVTQAFPGEHVAAPVPVMLAQQGWLVPPHATQLDPPPDDRQMVLGAVHRLPVQQGAPKAPQVPHAPSAQV